MSPDPYGCLVDSRYKRPTCLFGLSSCLAFPRRIYSSTCFGEFRFSPRIATIWELQQYFNAYLKVDVCVVGVKDIA